MIIRGKDNRGCASKCNPLDGIIMRLEDLERRAQYIVAKVQGITPDGEGNVTLPTSDRTDGPLYGSTTAFAMSSEVKDAYDDLHAYTSAVADDVVDLQTEIVALSNRIDRLEPQDLNALIAAIQTLQETVATIEEAMGTLQSEIGALSDRVDAMNPQDIEDLKAAVQGLQSSVSTLQQDVQSLASSLRQEIQALATSFRGELQSLEQIVTTLESSKQDTITGGASSITSNDLTADKALVSNSNGKVAASSVSSTELGYVGGVTSPIQTQLNGKLGTNANAVSATSATQDGNGRNIVNTYATKTEVTAQISTETSARTAADQNLQSQLDGKVSKSGDTMTGELKVDGGDFIGGSKFVLVNGLGQITNSGSDTLFGFTHQTSISCGSPIYDLRLRGNASRPTYNGSDIALSSDIPDVSGKQDRLTAGTGISIENNVISATGGGSSDTPVEIVMNTPAQLNTNIPQFKVGKFIAIDRLYDYNSPNGAAMTFRGTIYSKTTTSIKIMGTGGFFDEMNGQNVGNNHVWVIYEVDLSLSNGTVTGITSHYSNIPSVGQSTYTFNDWLSFGSSGGWGQITYFG